MRDSDPALMLSVRGIAKAFGSNQVLKGVDLDVRAGEVVALIGGNGAGKSTLMKIIMGIYQHDGGDIAIAGEAVRLSKPSVALAHGVYLVPQEPMLFPNMSVEENVLMGLTQKKALLHKNLAALIQQLNWTLDLNRKAESLSIADQQLVELLRGLMRNTRILILDEPTSALTFSESQSLFDTIENLKKKGISIIYITHRLTEVFTVASRVTIMRDGVITLDGAVADFTREMLVQGLLPENAKEREIKAGAKPVDYAHAKPVLVVDKFTGHGFAGVDLKVYPGEILGLAGVVGAGRTELAMTIFGRDPHTSGRVYLEGADITGKETRQIIDMGLSYVAEDRFLNGIFRMSGVAENTTASNLNNMGRFFMNRHAERRLADYYIDAFHTRVTGRDQVMSSLSGGNQQKVVIARSLAIKPKVVILDEPTRGIDAGARGDVYAIIEQLKTQGLAILLISSDMEEIVELSDRVMTMYYGRINMEFPKDQITQDNLMSAAFGVVKGIPVDA